MKDSLYGRGMARELLLAETNVMLKERGALTGGYQMRRFARVARCEP
jgi:hypothetical protein